MPHLLERIPETDDELWWYLYAVWGINIPRVKVCHNHSAPFDALSEAFFARTPVSVWKASRGFGGKSTLMAALSTMEIALLGAEVAVLGGSSSQSQRVHAVSKEMWMYEHAPKELLDRVLQYETFLHNGAMIRALMASSKSVRGGHPQRLRLDEVDEMELDILESAQGQPMAGRSGIKAQTVMSSTHQYPDKTMSWVLNRAKEMDWPVHEWCWRESVGTDEQPGWLTMEDVETKQREVTDRMWAVEYELQEPSFEGRAIDTQKVEEAFDPELGTFEGQMDEWIVTEPYDRQYRYVTGVDWAKSQDLTVVRTFKLLPPTEEGSHWQEVSFLRTGKKTWPDIVAQVDLIMLAYPGMLAHDATGLGGVISDLIQHDNVVDLVITGGQVRTALFNDYIAAIERGMLRSPRIEFAYNEHKYVTYADLFEPRGHAPDSFVAGALAWNVRARGERIAVAPAVVRKTSQLVSTTPGGLATSTVSPQPPAHQSDRLAPSQAW